MHNLQEIFVRLNAKFFGGKITARIYWTNFGQKSRWGYYKERQRVIMINQVLNANSVPREVVETVVYHEMCHQAYPPRRDPLTGRREIHHAEFKAGEARYPNIQYWRDWRNKLERDTLDKQLGVGEDQLTEHFRHYATQYGLQPSDLGRSYRIRQTIFTIIGLNPSRPKYPILVVTQRGKKYVEQAQKVRQYLSTSSTSSPKQTVSEDEEDEDEENVATRIVKKLGRGRSSKQDSEDEENWATRIVNKKRGRGRGRPSKQDSEDLARARRILGRRRRHYF